MKGSFFRPALLSVLALALSPICLGATGWSSPPQTQTAPVVEDRDSAANLLRSCYLLSRDFIPLERAFVLVRLSQAASSENRELATKWSEEAFRTAGELDPSWNRLALQKNALLVLSAYRPERAVELLGTMDAPVPAGDGIIWEDVRSHAATTIFMNYFKKTGITGLARIRRVARVLGDGGEYPFRAVQDLYPEVQRKSSLLSERLMAEALRYYRGQLRTRSAQSDFVNMVLALKPYLPSDTFRNAVLTAVERLEAENGRDEHFTAYVGQDKISRQSDLLLWKLLPELREFDVSKAEQLQKVLPEHETSKPVPITSAVVSGSDVHLTAAEDERLTEEMRLVSIQRMTPSQLSQAQEFAMSISDPALRSRALIALSKLLDQKKDSRQRRNLLDDASKLLDSAGDKVSHLQAIADLAPEFATNGETEKSVNLIGKGLDLGSELLQEESDTTPGEPAFLLPAYEPSASLVQLGMRLDPDNTLEKIKSLRNQVLKTHLLIDVASGLEQASHVQ